MLTKGNNSPHSPHTSLNDTQYHSFTQVPSVLPSADQFHTPFEEPCDAQGNINEGDSHFTNPSFTSFSTPQNSLPTPSTTQAPITYDAVPATTFVTSNVGQLNTTDSLKSNYPPIPLPVPNPHQVCFHNHPPCTKE